MTDKCSYYGCENEVCDSEKMSDGEMKFCQEHLERLNAIINEIDATVITAFGMTPMEISGTGHHKMLHGYVQ